MSQSHTLPQTESQQPQAMEVVDHFFRHQHSKIIANFTAKFGIDNIALIEDAVQDALYRAMKIWPYRGLPPNPSAWIFKVANNRLIDKLRKAVKTAQISIMEGTDKEQSDIFYMPDAAEIEDDQLKMIFTCCHPSLSEETQIILTLNLLCGLGTTEIARSLLKNKTAIAKALTRGKQKFKEEIGSLKPPLADEIPERLQVVLKVIYLLFNEGYKATRGDALVDETLITEAIRLGMLLLNKHAGNSELNALMALMYFQSSRINARKDDNGNLLSMKEQNRNLWDYELIYIGRQYLAASSGYSYISEYHIQAAIAGLHCATVRFEDTNWQEMLRLYDLQVSYNRLPIAEMNRVVPLAKVRGAKAGLDEIERLRKYPQLLKNHLYYAIKAELLEEVGKYSEAKIALKEALQLVSNETERRFLELKLKKLKR